MRQNPVKAYGNIHPVGDEAFEAVSSVIRSWNLDAEMELNGDLLSVAFEGVFFPVDEIVDALKPFLTSISAGKVDLLDLEEWMLTRYEFRGERIHFGKRDLNQVLEYSGY